MLAKANGNYRLTASTNFKDKRAMNSNDVLEVGVSSEQSATEISGASSAPTSTKPIFPKPESNSDSQFLPEAATANTSSVKEAPSTVSENSGNCKPATGALLDLSIVDWHGKAIPHLSLKVLVKGTEVFNGATDDKGRIPPIEGLPIGSIFEIQIKKDNGSYKLGAIGKINSDESAACLQSPKTRFEFSTEPHLGMPGGAIKHKENVTKNHNQKPTEKPEITGNPDKKPEVKSDRDDKGLPKATVTDGFRDWYNRNADNVAPPPSTSGDIDRVKKLIEFGELQAHWKYDNKITSSAYVKQMMDKTFQVPPSKPMEGFQNSIQRCAKYVKIALWYAGYGSTNEVIGPAIDPAKNMGPELIKAGFRDITSQIPDGRWAAPGDVIVYQSKGAPSAAGHIDIRTYDGYLSDFLGLYLPVSKFVVTGIYRKYHDPLPEKRMRAFLKVFREWECHEERDDSQRYFYMMEALEGSRRFTDTETHPFTGKIKGKDYRIGTPAGTYQITLETYTEFTGERYGIGRGFSPAKQDRLAVAIMEATSNALALVRKGEIHEAVKKLSGRWSSFPTGKHPRKEKRGDTNYVFSMDDILKAYEANLSAQ
jgi:muramidase (phage lysozyme)